MFSVLQIDYAIPAVSPFRKMFGFARNAIFVFVISAVQTFVKYRRRIFLNAQFVESD
jgi:hypothetical protein